MASITKRGSSFSIRVSAGYTTSGKQIFKTMTWKIPEGMSEKKAEKEVKHQAELFEERVRTGQIADGKIKFQDFADRWFRDYADIQLRPTTLNRYRDMMTRINAAFGHMYMDQIRPAHLMNFYKELSTTKTCTKVHCTIDLRDLIKKSGMTKDKLAASAGVSRSVIDSIYHDGNIEREGAERLSDALQRSFSSTFEDADDSKVLSPKTVQH